MNNKGYIIIWDWRFFVFVGILLLIFYGYNYSDEQGYISEGSSLYSLGKIFDLQPPSQDLIEDEILVSTNNERTSRGLNLLNFDRDLSLIAREHSEDMAARDFYDHTNPDGDGPTERAQKKGISIYNGDWIGIAENIAVVYVSNDADCSTNDEITLGECLVSKWMRSPGHRENILDVHYDSIGIGVFCDTSECYATQTFR